MIRRTRATDAGPGADAALLVRRRMILGIYWPMPSSNSEPEKPPPAAPPTDQPT
jgi:hypothetical protein